MYTLARRWKGQSTDPNTRSVDLPACDTRRVYTEVRAKQQGDVREMILPSPVKKREEKQANTVSITYSPLLGYRRPVERCEQPGRPVATRVRRRGQTGGGGFTRRIDHRIGPLHRPGNRVARGGTQGELNCLTHALPRSPDAFRRRLRRRMGAGTAPSPGEGVPWAAA